MHDIMEKSDIFKKLYTLQKILGYRENFRPRKRLQILFYKWF